MIILFIFVALKTKDYQGVHPSPIIYNTDINTVMLYGHSRTH